jgi:shikimate dehydrogenase
MELGITGWPVARTHSPIIHAEFLRISGIEGSYREYPIESDEFAPLLARLHLVGLRGLNITYPYKTTVMDSCCNLDPEAAAIGAVNTLLSVDGGWKGFNTDVTGLQQCLGALDAPDPVFVIGAGGAARAVTRALALASRNFTVFCRNPVMWGGEGKARPLKELSDHLRISSGTVVNATTLGWKDDDELPFKSVMPGRIHFIDLNYNPRWEWRNRLSDHGVNITTGEGLLVRQAAESFRIWTGVHIGEAVISRIIDEFGQREDG